MRLVPIAILASLSASAWLVACGSDSKTTTDGDPGGGSGSGSGSGSGGGNGTLTLSGIAKDITINGTTPLPGVMMTAYNASDDSVLGMATTGSDGSFSITVHATTVDGYLKATYGTTYKITYLYPPHPLTMDYANVPVYVVSQTNYNLVNGVILQNGQSGSNGWVAMLLQDAAGSAVAGGTVTSSPMGTVNYNGSDGKPSKTAMMTFTDGIAYDTNIAVGTVTVSATATGHTFTSHPIKVRADSLTLTLVTP